MKKELVHGLEEPAYLKDYDYAYLLNALKYMEIKWKAEGNTQALRYLPHLRRRLRIPFSRLVKRTKRKNLELRTKPTNCPLEVINYL